MDKKGFLYVAGGRYGCVGLGVSRVVALASIKCVRTQSATAFRADRR